MREWHANTDPSAVTRAIAGGGSPRFAFAAAITYANSLAGPESLAGAPSLAIHGSVTCVCLGALASTCALAGAGAFTGGITLACPVLMAFPCTLTCCNTLALACAFA
jgi:hypothetical protein